ncbi:hypothetical protein [Photobacterium kishitanii]|uniref:hypothetical protein n=1 Tax=Photobacterium kishitanii TaxID=318456 RepID=UPI0027394B9A|nr:hypothetical protein [Photobacterium kishitanii]
MSGCSWIECHVYIDGKDRPITSRVWLEERIQLAGSWLTMPNCRLEQAAYISAVRRALGVRGVYDYDENTLAEVMDMSNQPSAGVNYLVEDDSCDHALEEMINIVATDKSSNDDEVQVEKSTENIKLIKARIELLELELEDLSSDSIEYVEAKTSLLKLKKQLTLKLQKPAEEDMALVETSTIINDHQMPAAVVPSVAEKTTSIFRPSARDRSTLNNYKNYVANSGIDSVIQHIESDHSLVKPGLTTWLISQLKAA